MCNPAAYAVFQVASAVNDYNNASNAAKATNANSEANAARIRNEAIYSDFLVSNNNTAYTVPYNYPEQGDITLTIGFLNNGDYYIYDNNIEQKIFYKQNNYWISNKLIHGTQTTSICDWHQRGGQSFGCLSCSACGAAGIEPSGGIA